MKNILFLALFLMTSYISFAQSNLNLAYEYYRSGEYEKALPYFKKLHQKHTYSDTYFSKLISCYKQLKQFSEAERAIKWQFKKYRTRHHLWVYLGSIYKLQGKLKSAKECYQKAIDAVQENPSLANYIGKAFAEEHLLDEALFAYKKAMEYDNKQNFYYKIAQIYAEKDDFEKMFNSYLNAIEKGGAISSTKRYMGNFITDDNENANNKTLQKLLLKRSQNNPKAYWNQLLSWLFIQQHEYNKALIQQKALFKRDAKNLKHIINLGAISFENKDFVTAEKCFGFIIKNTSNLEQKLNAEIKLLDIRIATKQSNLQIEQQFQKLLTTYGTNKATLNLQIAYANFNTFQQKQPQKAIAILNKALKIPSSRFTKGRIKNKLADVLVFTNQFNSALIYYTQVQNDLKNYPIAQESRYKIALTSYFKGDFQWAKAQLKVLKSATSKLIANDALELFLLITNNTEKDSTQINLKKYANAHLLAFQNKNKQAIDSLQQLLKTSKGKSIEDDALYKQAQLFEKENMFKHAESNYLKIIEFEKSNLKDDAIYHLAKLYLTHLKNEKKAVIYYKKIIFEYPSSIYLVDARKKYRKLRSFEETSTPL